MEIGCFGAPGRDPRTRVITIAHFALSPMGSLHPDAGDDAADAQLFSIESSLQQTDALGRLVTLHVRQAKAKGVLGKVQIRQKQRRIGRQVQWQTEREGKSFLASDHDLMLFQALRSLCALGERALPLLLPQSFSKGTLEQAQGVLQALRADVGGVWCD